MGEKEFAMFAAASLSEPPVRLAILRGDNIANVAQQYGLDEREIEVMQSCVTSVYNKKIGRLPETAGEMVAHVFRRARLELGYHNK